MNILALSVVLAGTSPYKVDLATDLSLTLGAGTIWAIMDFAIKPSMPEGLGCQLKEAEVFCDPTRLSPLDAFSVGKSNTRWKTTSDVLLYSSFGIPVLALGLASFLDGSDSPWQDIGTDLLVVAETAAITGAVTTLLKFAVRRPRPGQYSDSVREDDFDRQLSFPSGHTSMVTAMMTSFATTIWLRYPSSPWRFVTAGAGLLVAGTTAFARIQSGNHFPTDVIAGFAIGASIGILVPMLHRRSEASVVPSVQAGGENRPVILGMSGRF